MSAGISGPKLALWADFYDGRIFIQSRHSDHHNLLRNFQNFSQNDFLAGCIPKLQFWYLPLGFDLNTRRTKSQFLGCLPYFSLLFLLFSVWRQMIPKAHVTNIWVSAPALYKTLPSLSFLTIGVHLSVAKLGHRLG